LVRFLGRHGEGRTALREHDILIQAGFDFFERIERGLAIGCDRLFLLGGRRLDLGLQGASTEDRREQVGAGTRQDTYRPGSPA
jgi:hypothetical protein